MHYKIQVFKYFIIFWIFHLVPIDVKKKAKHSASNNEETKNETENQSSGEEYTPGDPLNDPGTDFESTESDSPFSDEEEDAKKQIALLNKKLKAKALKRRKEEVKQITPAKKAKGENEATTSRGNNVSAEGETGEKTFEGVGNNKKSKREAPTFNDKNVDYNLYSNDPDNVVTRKIKVSSNVIV